MPAFDSSDLTVREPSPGEVGRVFHLFRSTHLPRRARAFAVVKSRPLERFVAAAAWWPMDGRLGFRLAAQPGSAARLAACDLLVRKMAECGRTLGVECIQYAELLAGDNEWVPLLRDHGFAASHSERFFEVSAGESLARTMKIAERMRDKFPPSWRTESIRHLPPEIILKFIEPARLMSDEEVRDRWRADCPTGFELDLSAVLFDGARPVGVFLMRRMREVIYIDVRMVQTGNRLFDSLGNVALFYHTAVKGAESGVTRLQFRGGEIEHRETANLALRMGGTELPSRHLLTKPL